MLFFNALYSLALLYFLSSFVDLLVIFCTVALLCCELLALPFLPPFSFDTKPTCILTASLLACKFADLHFLLECFFSEFKGNASVTCYKKDCKKAQFSCFFFFFCVRSCPETATVFLLLSVSV